MKNKINIATMIGSLTPKEQAKMMVLCFDEEFASGKSSLTKEEKDMLRTFDKSQEREEYAFYFDLRFNIAPIINTSIESSTLRFVICYLTFMVDVLSSSEDPKDERVERIRKGMQGHYNRSYTYKALAGILENKYDFPVIGGYNESEIEANLDSLEIYKQKIDKVYTVYMQNMNNDEIEHHFIVEAKNDDGIINELVAVVEKLAKESGI